ncbi:hypothetical protein ACFL2Q_10050 [Thermodesulfobacteriota bacterium]
MAKTKIDARQVLTDLRSGLDDVALMKKYNLSAKGLQSLFNALVNSGLINRSVLEVWMPSVAQAAALGAKEVSARDVLADIKAGSTEDELMSKYKISAKGLQHLFEQLLDAGLITEADLEQAPYLENTVDITASVLEQDVIEAAKIESGAPLIPPMPKSLSTQPGPDGVLAGQTGSEIAEIPDPPPEPPEEGLKEYPEPDKPVPVQQVSATEQIASLETSVGGSPDLTRHGFVTGIVQADASAFPRSPRIKPPEQQDDKAESPVDTPVGQRPVDMSAYASGGITEPEEPLPSLDSALQAPQEVTPEPEQPIQVETEIAIPETQLATVLTPPPGTEEEATGKEEPPGTKPEEVEAVLNSFEAEAEDETIIVETDIELTDVLSAATPESSRQTKEKPPPKEESPDIPQDSGEDQPIESAETRQVKETDRASEPVVGDHTPVEDALPPTAGPPIAAVEKVPPLEADPGTDQEVETGPTCPSCGKPRPEEIDKCPECGVSVDKFLQRTETDQAKAPETGPGVDQEEPRPAQPRRTGPPPAPSRRGRVPARSVKAGSRRIAADLDQEEQPSLSWLSKLLLAVGLLQLIGVIAYCGLYAARQWSSPEGLSPISILGHVALPILISVVILFLVLVAGYGIKIAMGISGALVKNNLLLNRIHERMNQERE